MYASSALENARIARVCCLCYVIADVICASPNGALSQYREDQGPACRQGRTALCVWQCFPSTCIWPCGLLELISVLLLLGLCAETQTDKDAENFEVSWACQVFDADMPTYRQGVCVRARVRSWFQKII